ncbi:uncharacterized protein cubi_02505 [Cryptosporidium ubiquitum]|uniref:GYF domain-containing protein n=1 Tax=Cryptosporidium ubiquitum TaxID=857276 RepID=A0A1J4MGC7_9CRYT|nr:uncharacterized protein cubi_02505 [Cryptosporidium ubiquitum]OII73273.1 hypothetical protein cubi_02505 [Cryptosporidium ubiquitum]
MNQSRNNSYKFEQSNLNIRQIISKNIYPIKVLLKLYKPLNVPKSIFKLETVVQKNNSHGSSNFSYVKNTGSNGQYFNNLERKNKNGYFNNYNKTSGTFESNQSPPKTSKVSEDTGASGITDGYSWRKNKPITIESTLNQECAQINHNKSCRNNEGTEVIGSFSALNRINDLEEDMSSIKKILNKRFEKESIDSEKFIRNKLVMALEGIDYKNSQNHNNEMLSGIVNDNEKSKILFSDKLIETGSNLTDEMAHNTLCNDLKEIQLSNNFYKGNYTSLDSRLFKSNIVKNNILNAKHLNNSRTIQNVNINNDINNFNDNSKVINNNINLMEIETEDSSLVNNFQNNHSNLRIDSHQFIQNNQNNIGLEIRQEIDVLDNPMWLYKESGSFTVNGPFSTKQMSSLWKSYTFTHKTLFTMISKYVWGPINLFYPDVKSTFTYIPDLEVISQRLTDVSFQNDKVEKIKSEDISSIISEINELQLNVSDHISAPKLINNTINSEKVNKNCNIEKNDSNTLNSENNHPIEVQELKSNEFVVESQKNEKSCEFEPKIQYKSTKVPWGGVNSDNSKTKKEVINFQDILRQEEISSKEKLKIEAMNRANDLCNSEALNIKDTPKGWKKIIPKEKSTVFLESINVQDPQGCNQSKQSFAKVPNSVNLNINHGNKWKGWGIKTGEPTNTELFESITLYSTNNFSKNQKQKNNQNGFWEMCNSDSLQKNSVLGNSDHNVTCNKVNDSLALEAIDHKAECNFDEIDKAEMNKDFYDKESTFTTTNKPSNHKNKRKKGKKVDSSLLAFGIRSDKPRNLNYDLD